MKLPCRTCPTAILLLALGACQVTPDSDEKASSDSSIAITATTVTLTWDDNSANEDGFVIERKMQGGTYAEVARVEKDVKTFKDTGLMGGTEYCYRVAAFNATTTSSFSNESCKTTAQ